MEIKIIWEEIINWVTFGIKWEIGVIKLLMQNEPFWIVLARALTLTNLRIIIAFGVLNSLILFFKKIVQPLIKLLRRNKFARFVLLKLHLMKKNRKKKQSKFKIFINSLLEKQSYKNFFILSAFPIVPYITELAVVICRSAGMNKKGFWIIIGGTCFKVLYELGFIYLVIHVIKTI